MQLSRFFAAAGLVVASLGVSATADAQGPRGPHGPGSRGDHHWDDRGPGRGPGHDRGPRRHDWRGDHHRGPDFRHDRYRGRHDYRGWREGRRYGYNRYNRGRCYVTWRNHRQVRVCR